jgi:hypothetical protein
MPPSGGCAAPKPPPQMMNFLLPLTPPILLLEGSCSKNQETIGSPFGFFSCKLTDTESRYSTFDRESLAAQAAIKHFRHFCKGRAFQLWTDHKPLVLPFSASQPLFHPDSKAIWRSSQNLMYSFCICPFKKMLLMFCPAQPHMPLDQLPPQQGQIQWNSKRWPLRNTAARKAGC